MESGELELVFDLKSGEQKHPADEIALALLRAGGILSSLTNCYDADGGEFAIDATFLAEAIRSAEQIIFKANDSLTSLYQDYSLELVSDAAIKVPSQTHESEFVESKAAVQTIDQTDETSRFSRKLDTKSEVESAAELQNQSDGTVQTYEEFFEKLTGT